MSKREITVGATSQTIDVFVQDSSVSTGAGLTGLVYNTASLTAYYRKGATGTPTAITLATQTVGGAYSSGGFVAVDGTNCPGQYRLDLPDAMVDTLGMVTVHLKGATNMAPCVMEIEVVAVNKFDAVRMGMTAIPNVAAGAIGGVPLSVDANGYVAANVTHAGTAQAGASTTITLASGASATSLYYYHQLVQIVSGTGAGQVRQIVGYIGSTKVATVNYAWQTNPDNTSVYRLIGDHVPFCDSAGTVWAYNHAGSAVATITATNALATLIGTPVADLATDIAGVAASSATAVWAAGTRTLTSFGTLVADVWSYATRLLTAGTNIVLAKGTEITGFNDPTAAANATAVRSELTTELGRIDAAVSTRLATAGYTVPPTAAAIADAVTDEAVSDHTTAGTVGAQLASIYAAQIDFADDNANTKDEYSVQWFKNGAPVTSGITAPTIQVVSRSDGSDLVAVASMTQIGSTGAYKYDEGTNRITDGEAVVVQVQATIDGSTRTWRKLVSRDASA